MPMKRAPFSAFPTEGFEFLRSLKRHNNREWFLSTKAIYEHSVKQPMEISSQRWLTTSSNFAPEMVASPKASAYRIYRDTRFSKDKSPYKTHVAAVFPRRAWENMKGQAFICICSH